ncbi:MAG: RidA family protein [Candidatus Dormibacteraeota bacterium]|nr:RidA family protein [Candidatus Dormibacteraeota bacterium]
MGKHAEPLIVAGLPDAVSHYCHAVRFGDLVYVSGLVAMDERGGVLGKGEAAAQTEVIFQQLGMVLDTVGAAPADVLKVTVFLRNVDDRPRINPVRQRFFGDHLPASTLVEVSRLIHEDLLVEIEAVVGIAS